MTSCRHLVVVGAANMERGTFTIKKWPSNFFFQDVVCHYCPFANDVGLKLTQY
jgi:hypothetical protein